MKTKRIFSILAAAALAISVSAQQSAHDNYIGVNFGGGLNTMLYKSANGQQAVGAGFDAGLFYGRFFNRTVGLGVGLQYTWANAYATYNWSEVTTGLKHPSNPNTPYNLTTGFSDFVERQNIGVLSIPVEVLFRKAFNDRVALIGGVGLSLDLPLHGKYVAKGGIYSTTGVFPELGSYVISEMPEHGFSTYDNAQGAKFNNRAKAGASVIGDLGARIALNDNWGIYCGIYIGYGFTNLLAEAKTEEMIMINATDPSKIDYRGTFDSNETAKANLLRFGAKIAIDLGWSDKNGAKAKAKQQELEEQQRLAAEQARQDSIAAVEAAQAAAAAEKARQDSIVAAEQARQDSIAAAEKAAAEEEARKEAEFLRSVEAFSVHFDVEKAKLSIPEDEKKVVDELCERMIANKSVKIVITGHTDNYGDPRQNLEFFGLRRAESLRDYMVEKGVSADQITCKSKGDTEPVAPNDTRANRALNRRANIEIVH